MDNLSDLLGIRRIDRMLNARVREMCGVEKSGGKRIYVIALWWFGHTERMESCRIVERLYKWECMGSRPVIQLRKGK